MEHKQQRTNKKVKIIGTEEYINAQTGEIERMQVTSIEERDFNFHKVWLKNFIATLDLVGNQKTKLAFWIIENLNKENQLTMTYRQIATATNMSLDTVSKTMKILLDADFLRKINIGVYMVNPDVVFKGSRNGRLNVLNQYRDSERITIPDEEKLQNLLKSIDMLQKQAQTLMYKIHQTESPADADAVAPSDSTNDKSDINQNRQTA